MPINYPDIIKINNPKASGIVDAIEVAGHKTVADLESLYALPDAILSQSKTNENNDAIGQLWYVVSESKYYQLISWDSTGKTWEEFKTGSSDIPEVIEGKGVSSIKTMYAINNSNTIPPTTWYDNSPVVTNDNPYLWQKIKTYFTDGTETEWSYNVIGAKGDKGIDGISVEYIYKLTQDNTQPAVPTDSSPITSNNKGEWTDDPQGVDSTNRYEWVSEHEKIDGTWQAYKEATLWAKWSEDGISPNTSFKSTVFTRTNEEPSTPTGGSYENPIPEDKINDVLIWSDGIPEGDAILWATTRIFSSDGKDPQQAMWTTPRQLTNTSNFDVVYSIVESPKAPEDHPNINSEWTNSTSTDTIWMATSVCINGSWEAWKISKIKGEKGDDGTSIKIQGTLDSEDNLPIPPEDASHCYIIGQNLYVWDGNSWVNAGPFKGDPGTPAYLHIKYANSLTEGDWTNPNGETPGAYIGVYSDNSSTDLLVWSLYTWTKWKGEDGFGYEYIYQQTATYEAPDVPTVINNNDNYVPSGWTDDPQDVNEDNPYCWVCYRKKTNGTWGSFIGSSSNNSKAALWAKWSKDGINSVRIDLDNENDSMLYNGAGELISGSCISNITLYDGATNVTSSATYNITENNVTAKLSNHRITVTGMTASTGSVTVKATYKEFVYTAIMSLKKIVNGDKYEIVLSPTSIAYNITTGNYTSDTVNIAVYRTSQNEGRKYVEDLNTYNLKLYYRYTGMDLYNEITDYGNNRKINLNYNEYEYELRDVNNIVLDHETLIINKSENGVSKEGIVIQTSKDSIVLKKSSTNQTSYITVALYDNGEPQDASNYTVNITSTSLPEGLSATVSLDSTLNNWKIITKLSANYDIDYNISYTITYNNITYNKTLGFVTIIDGEDAVSYEIIPTDSYYIVDQNKTENNINCVVQGYLYKIEGNSRTIVPGATLEGGYNETIESDSNTSETTDENGYFSFGSENSNWDTSTDTWGDNNVLNSNSYIVRYKIDGIVVAQFSVGMSQYGLNGSKGSNGKPLRITTWTDKGWTYQSGENSTDSFTDIVYYNKNYYRCVKNHISSSSYPPTNNSDWTLVENFGNIATGVLLSENAYISILSGNKIEVSNTVGDVKAGLAGVDNYPIWAGTDFDSRESAPFKVDSDGSTYMSKAYVEGVVTAKALYRGIKVVYPMFFPIAIDGYTYDIAQSNSNPDNPTYEDFIFIKDAFESTDNLWDYAQDVNRFPPNGHDTYNVTSCGNVYLPNPEGLEGKEVTVINNTNPQAAELLLYTATIGSYFFNVFGDGDCKYISLKNIKKIHLVSGKFLTDSSQWIVLDVETKE